MKVPLGCTLEEVVAQAGGTTVKDPVYFVGGPMMGRIGNGSDPVTKTTNAILVLPKDHVIVMKKQRTSSIDLKRAASICCHCHTCTDLCPRHNLGHPIDPAMFMMAASNQDFRNVNPYNQFCILQLLWCLRDVCVSAEPGSENTACRYEGRTS